MESTNLKEPEQIRLETDKQDRAYLDYLSNFFPPTTDESVFDLERYCTLKSFIYQVARKHRSVNIVKHFLKLIFFQDLDQFKDDQEELNEKIVIKFELCKNLASCVNVTLKELFTYCSSDICGKVAFFLLISDNALEIIDYFIGEGFFLDTMLPRAWFFLLKNSLLTPENFINYILPLGKKRDPNFHQYLKISLYVCIAKIAMTKKLTLPQRKSLLNMIKQVFQFKTDQELQDLYKQRQEKWGYIESKVLNCLVNKFGFGKYYFLERLMTKREEYFTLPYYRQKDQLNRDFFRKKSGSDDKLVAAFQGALEFLNKELKKNPSTNTSDYAVCFLDVFNSHILDKLVTTTDSMQKQGILMQFIRVVEVLLKKVLVDDENFRRACIQAAIYILKIGIAKEDTVEISMLSMQVLLNSLGLKHSLGTLDKFFTLSVHAFLSFPNHQKVKKYTSKILSFYIKDKQSYSQSYFQDYQFLLLRKLQEQSALREIVSIISAQIYTGPDQIADHLKYLFSMLHQINEDQRILNTMYILELLESQEQNDIRKVLVSPDVLKALYQSVLDLPQQYKTETNKQMSIICAKIIASIGLCQPFVNDPLTLKATNQTTLIGKKRMDGSKPDQYGAQNVTKSDHYNPITNMNLRKQDTQSIDNTLELLAMPILNEIPIERIEVIKFAEQLSYKIKQITYSTDEPPKNYFYALFLLEKFIYQQRQIQGLNQNENNEFLRNQLFKLEQLSQAVARFIKLDISEYKELVSFKTKSTLKPMSFYLINKIQDKNWQDLFIACIPLIQKCGSVVQDMLLPFLMYYALRFCSNNDTNLPKQIGEFMNEVLDSNHQSQIVTILRAQDFLQIALMQDKSIFKKFVEKETKFKYIEKLFYVDLDEKKAKETTVINFIKIIEGQLNIKHSFLCVQKIKTLLSQIDKQKRIKGAQTVKNYKRCVYNFEDNFRSIINQANKGFLDILSQEEAIEIVQLMKRLNPEDFDQGFFNSIIQTFKLNISFQQKTKIVTEECKKRVDEEEGKRMKQRKLLKEKYDIPNVNEYWKNGQWDFIQDWMEGFDFHLMYKDPKLILLDRDCELTIQRFEYLIAMFVGTYHKGLKAFLQNDDTVENPQYLKALSEIDLLFKMLYHEFMINLDEQQGEIQYYYKLFLHVIYELESAVHYLKDIFIIEKDKISEILKKEVNREKRRFEKIYYDFDMNKYFERLMSWFEERSLMIQSSTESLKLIYYTRRMIFSLFDRENEYAYYLMRLARLFRKTSNEILIVSKLFKECEELHHKIIDYELENSKYKLKTTNAHDAYRYLFGQLEQIKKKSEDMYKATKFHWMPSRIYEKAVLYSIELQIKYDPRNPEISQKFENFVKSLGKKEGWEKPYFKMAQYMDFLESPATGIQQLPLQQVDPKKRQISKIYYYMNSLKYGHKYIWQSLPRILELWFQFNDENSEFEIQKINEFMRQELSKLEIYKLATVLQILLSRYGHSKESVRDIIISVLSKIAISYPGQCAWWIFHFLHFEQDGQLTSNKRMITPIKAQAISRAEFAKNLLNRIHTLSEVSYKKIMECEKIFVDLKKLSEKTPSQPQATSMEIPQTLSKVSSSHLVMPIEENLSPQLPPENYTINFLQTCLVQTTEPINQQNPKNAQFSFDQTSIEQEEYDTPEKKTQNEFPAYKAKSVTISGFLPEATIMVSKEKPKKIGIVGSDRNIYNFLLKWDKYGDLRKEQRFIDFAVLCNKMLENDSESRKRNLRLRTYAITPLSRNTGLIEWIQNTTTLKAMIGEYWKKNNIRGEMHDIKQKAQNLKAGETHTQIWHILKEEIKPVLGSYMAEHYPSPAIWYEARINFIRSTAMWSMIGYVIGLGDRHGDNILIHNHTGEVTHVDFDCIFEKGAKLKIPEIVPFRLTQNIIDAFGIFKEKGVFLRTCEVVLRVLRKNSNNIISFLYSFIHDPLIENNNNIKVDINEALEVVKKKLYGQISGDKGGSATIEEQVELVVLNALNDEALSKMYIGWMPWL